jgi:2-hydroxy-6-oxonona-2,4-dienedioate hydrolase
MTTSPSNLTESSTGKFVQAGPLRIHYNEAGSGEPLIFCEGQGAGTSAWVVYHRVVEALAQHFRCLLLDQPGYGKSDPVVVKGESRSTMYARTIRDFMDALGIEKATIVDMSFGAQTAQVFAIENPERTNKLVLHASGLAGPTLFGHPPASSYAFIMMNQAFVKPGLETMRAMMHSFLFNGASYSDDELLLQQRVDAWLGRPELEEARRSSDAIQRDVTGDLKKITHPVLQLHGRNDLIAPLESALRLLSALPNSRLIAFGNCGHWIPIEKSAEFSRYVIDFVKNG